MVDSKRRTILASGAAATAMAAAGSLAQQGGQGAAAKKFYEKGGVRIHYDEVGTGFPLLVIPGGGLNSDMSNLTGTSPFNPLQEFKNEFRVITSDLRNGIGQSTGPLDVDRPWDMYTDDHLGLMDHLGIKQFMVMGFCVGGPMSWNLLKRAPNRSPHSLCITRRRSPVMLGS